MSHIKTKLCCFNDCAKSEGDSKKSFNTIQNTIDNMYLYNFYIKQFN
jgi:hypothetical protein